MVRYKRWNKKWNRILKEGWLILINKIELK